jgi:sulfatase maturation enzyme AslB (radical SAM superfamily)
LKKLFVTGPCTECDILNICGGRCLYADITKRWNKDAYGEICQTVRSLVTAIEAQVPRIKELIKNGKVKEQDFKFMQYNGCEIIP